MSMSWRIHLTNQAIRDLLILSARQPLLVVWTASDRVEFFDVATGVANGFRKFPPAPASDDYFGEEWQAVLSLLTDSYGRVSLPRARIRQYRILSSENGDVRLLNTADNRLYLLKEGKVRMLQTSQIPLAVDMHGPSASVAILDAEGSLIIARDGETVESFSIGLNPVSSAGAVLVCSQERDHIFASDGQRLVLTNLTGRVIGQRDLHYRLGRVACSPSGNMLATTDNEAGLIRVYNGIELRSTFQRFAQDLIAESQQLQLLADMPPNSAAISALALGDNGEFAFAVSGMVCLTDVKNMTPLL